MRGPALTSLFVSSRVTLRLSDCLSIQWRKSFDLCWNWKKRGGPECCSSKKKDDKHERALNNWGFELEQQNYLLLQVMEFNARGRSFIAAKLLIFLASSHIISFTNKRPLTLVGPGVGQVWVCVWSEVKWSEQERLLERARQMMYDVADKEPSQAESSRGRSIPRQENVQAN